MTILESIIEERFFNKSKSSKVRKMIKELDKTFKKIEPSDITLLKISVEDILNASVLSAETIAKMYMNYRIDGSDVEELVLKIIEEL